MEITLLPFANACDSFGFSSRSITADPSETPLDIVRRIAPQVDTTWLRVAIDCEFASWDTPLGDARELAFLPPVSGG